MSTRPALGALAGGPVGLVGRVVELARLRAALDEACGGRTRTIVLAGPGGIGKSRLLLELAGEARAAGAAVVAVACERDAPPGWPWHAILRCVGGPRWSDATHDAATVAMEALDVHGGGAPAFAARDLLAAALRTAAGERPLALLVDDLDAADGVTLDLLAFVARQLAGAPLLVLAAHRDGAPALDAVADMPGFDRLALGRLAPEEVRALVAVEAGAVLPAYAVEQIVFVADGLPRTVRQAVRRLEEHGLLDRTAGRWLGPAADAEPAGRRVATVEEHVFRRHGAAWTLRFAAREVTIADARGLHDLAELLRRPGEAVHVLELTGGTRGTAAPEPVLDDAARAAYRRRLRELGEELAEAEAANDPGGAERARHQIAALTDTLATARGLGGRCRAMHHGAERARVAVRRRVAQAIARIERVHPALGEHLRTHVRTGYWCSYQAGRAQRLRWTV